MRPTARPTSASSISTVGVAAVTFSRRLLPWDPGSASQPAPAGRPQPNCTPVVRPTSWVGPARRAAGPRKRPEPQRRPSNVLAHRASPDHTRVGTEPSSHRAPSVAPAQTDEGSGMRRLRTRTSDRALRWPGAFSRLHPASSAQQVDRRLPVILASVPFTVAVRGGDDVSTLVEIRDSQGRAARVGPVAAGQTREFRDIAVCLARRTAPRGAGRATRSRRSLGPFAPGWFSILPAAGRDPAGRSSSRRSSRHCWRGIWLGALAVAGYNPLNATLAADRPVRGARPRRHRRRPHADRGLQPHAGRHGLGIISRNGGTRGVVQAVAPLARNRRRGKVATMLAGLAIFFDDYANTLVVGNTCDRSPTG